MRACVRVCVSRAYKGLMIIQINRAHTLMLPVLLPSIGAVCGEGGQTERAPACFATGFPGATQQRRPCQQRVARNESEKRNRSQGLTPATCALHDSFIHVTLQQLLDSFIHVTLQQPFGEPTNPRPLPPGPIHGQRQLERRGWKRANRNGEPWGVTAPVGRSPQCGPRVHAV